LYTEIRGKSSILSRKIFFSRLSAEKEQVFAFFLPFSANVYVLIGSKHVADIQPDKAARHVL
jgi:hypothetical protein